MPRQNRGEVWLVDRGTDDENRTNCLPRSTSDARHLSFCGTRVPVESLIQHLVAGDSLDVFLDDFPTVSREQAVAYLQMTLEFTDARVA